MTAVLRPAAPTGDVAGAGTAQTGTGRLTRFALRRDRIRIAAWAVAIGGLIGYYATASTTLYPDAAALESRASTIGGPSGAFLTGPGYGLAAYDLGAMISNELLGVLAVAAALLSISLVVRHTRAEEESGRAELLRAGVVGRYAPLTAALLTVLVADLALTLSLAVALTANGLPAADSAAVAVGAGLTGLLFGAVAAVTAQISEHARAASGLAGAVLGLAYVLRGVGDAQERGGSVLSWLSPIGWAQQTRAFVDLRWEPLLLTAGATVALVAVAYALAGRRDVAAGLIAPRPGRADAHPSLLSPVGLTTRMQRGVTAGWAGGLLVFALLTGSMAQAIVDTLEDQPQLAAAFGAGAGAGILPRTLAAFLGFFAMAVAVYAVASVNRLGREESEGRTEAVLATAVSRPAWLAGSLVVPLLGAAVLLLLSGLGLGLGAAVSVGDGGLVWSFTAAALVYLPLVACFAGLAALAHGLRAGVWLVWAVLVGAILIGLYGAVLGLPQAVLDAAPFALVPAVPGVELDVVPLVAMTLVAAALVGVAAIAYRRRDLTA